MDSNGHTIISIAAATILIGGCSYDSDTEIERRDSKPVESPAGLIANHCGKCHDGAKHPLKLDEASFKNPKVAKRISENTMPPGGGLADSVKAKLLELAKG